MDGKETVMRSVLGGEVSVGLVRVDTHLFTSYLISNALEVYDVIVLNLVDDGATDLSVDGAEGGVHLTNPAFLSTVIRCMLP